MDPRERLARACFVAALRAVEPRSCTVSALARAGLDAQRLSECGVLALGKAARGMLAGLCQVGTPRWALGVAPVAGEVARWPVLAGSHPLPTSASLEAGAQVARLAQANRGPVVVLLSGGASALVEHLQPGVTLDVLRAETRSLMEAGADIATLNAYRRTRSQLKGGGLLHMLGDDVVNIVLSDVIGPIQWVGSGPTLRPDGSGPPTFVAADNRTAVQAMADHARRQGLQVAVLEQPLAGEARDAGVRFVHQARATGAPVVVAGGETTVTVTGTGQGGRNQELALGAAAALTTGVVLAAGTDGVDGQSTHTGAVVGAWTPDGTAALQNNDSHTFFATHGGAVVTGPTGTNVADLAVWLR